MTVPVAEAGGALAPLQLVFPAAGAYLYYRRCRTLARQGRPVPGPRQLSFGFGIAVVAVAISPPFHALADELRCGDAPVAPREGVKTCRTCELWALCRVRSTTLRDEEGDDG